MTRPLTDLRDEILLAALPHVPFDGWTRRAMRRGAEDAGYGRADADRAFPYGAADMIARGYCTILASDYYYPALLLAAFRLEADGVVPLETAWSYVSERPARAAGLADRGALRSGARADVIMVDAADPLRPKTVAAVANGRFVHLTQPERLN